MPGGNGWGKTTSSCITKSTCSKATMPFTSIWTEPETSVSTCVTSYPVTQTSSEASVYTTTEASVEVGESTKTVYDPVTKSSVWSTYTTVSCFLCPSSSDASMIPRLYPSVTFLTSSSDLHHAADRQDKHLGRVLRCDYLGSCHLYRLRDRDQDHGGSQGLH